MTNPFEQQPAQQPAANPYAQQVPAPAQPAANPFPSNVPAQPAANPYAQQQAPAPAAPQAYTQPQTYVPNGQPTYAPAATAPPQAYQPPAQPQHGAPPAINVGSLQSVGAPPPTGDAKGAKLAHMYGRLVLVFPLTITRRPRNPQYITPEQRQRGDLEQDQLTATVIVLDDGRGGMAPITFGGDPAAFPPVPDTESAPLPYVRKAMWITQTKLIEQLRPCLPQGPAGQPTPAVGRVIKAGPQRNDPWYLSAADENDLGLARKYLELVQGGTYPHPLA
jgi:hypothetical protein